jgi:hypothetical protein
MLLTCVLSNFCSLIALLSVIELGLQDVHTFCKYTKLKDPILSAVSFGFIPEVPMIAM